MKSAAARFLSPVRLIAKSRLKSLSGGVYRSTTLRADFLQNTTLHRATRIDLEHVNLSAIEERLRQAGSKCSAPGFCLITFCSGLILALLSLKIFSTNCLPISAAIGVWLPLAWLDQKIQARALAFSVDYPSILMATASSIQVGLTPQLALERAVKLLPDDSVARLEVEKLLARLRDGISKEEAIQQFGQDYRLPDLELFRAAFLLVMETGGRFSPTLQRLASVSNNRLSLIKMAGVTTASMRMTANVLLCLAPAIILFLSFRIDSFWEVFHQHPTANFLASLGILMITFGYFILKKMSAFKP